MYKLTLLSLLIALPFGLVQAQTPEEKGLAIATEIDARDQGWQDQTSNMQMILTNRQGQSSTRKIRLSSLEVPGDGDKSISIFDEPADVKGTAFLSHTHAVKPDDQWLYLPALKRVKRISSSNKSGPFMGSEFAYEDIASQEVAKYTYKYLGEEEIDGRKMFINELYPQYKKSGYTRQVAWVDQERYVLLKVEFYDRKNTLLKTLNFVDYNQYLDKYWRPDEMHMVNHQTGKSSKLIWSDYTFQNGLSDSDFERSILQRLR
jgi:outer membrane lipoprotein-sorting protein